VEQYKNWKIKYIAKQYIDKSTWYLNKLNNTLLSLKTWKIKWSREHLIQYSLIHNCDTFYMPKNSQTSNLKTSQKQPIPQLAVRLGEIMWEDLSSKYIPRYWMEGNYITKTKKIIYITQIKKYSQLSTFQGGIRGLGREGDLRKALQRNHFPWGKVWDWVGFQLWILHKWYLDKYPFMMDECSGQRQCDAAEDWKSWGKVAANCLQKTVSREMLNKNVLRDPLNIIIIYQQDTVTIALPWQL